MKEQVTCQDCVHNRASWLNRQFKMNTWTWTCTKAYNEPEYNPVDGTTRKGYYDSCGVARVKKSVCGPDATAWEPRSKKNLFVYLKRI